MPDPVTGTMAAVSIGGGLLQNKAAKKATNAQVAQGEAGVAEQRAAREQMMQLLQPYTQAGSQSLQGMLNLIGLGSQEAQAAAIQQQQQNPLFQSLYQQGENAILQNASATGGLRGGNIQGALEQFRPALLNQFINQQYERMAGITSLGQNSAAGVGQAGIQTGNNIANIMGDIGAAQAGGALARGQNWSNMLGSFGGTISPMLPKSF